MPDILVLAYHAVSHRWPAALSVTPQALSEQLELLVDRGYRGATFHEAVHDPRGTRVLAVTFDDAFRSVVDLAGPILGSLELPATVFVPTDFAGRSGPMSWSGVEQWLGGPHEEELACLSWPELAQLAAAGWEIGSHTCSHPNLTRLDDHRLYDELARSRADCERRLGRPCRSLAYPYGELDDRVVAATRAAGYEAACALPDRLDSTDPLRYRRVGVYRGDGRGRFRAKVSPLGRRLWASTALQPLLRQLHRV